MLARHSSKFEIYLSKLSLSLKYRVFSFYPEGCTEQRTSKLKAFVEYVKYLKARDKPVPNEGYAAFYQGLLQTRRACTVS